MEELIGRVLQDPSRRVVRENLGAFLEIFRNYGFVFSFLGLSKIAEKVVALQNPFCKAKGLLVLVHSFAFKKHLSEKKWADQLLGTRAATAAAAGPADSLCQPRPGQPVRVLLRLHFGRQEPR